jgi:DNA-binding IclR family transcriptional regulator
MPLQVSSRDALGEGDVYRVQVMDRAFRILDVLAEQHQEMGLTELAERLCLHKSTAHRLLIVLERNRFVEKDPATAKYRLGWRLFELGTLAVSRLDVHNLAQPCLERLVEKTHETAHVGVLRGGELISIVNVEGSRNVRTPSTVGQRSPVYCTSQGKAIMSHLPEPMAAQILRSVRLSPFTRNTITRISQLKDELARVRARGYAIDNEECEEGLRCIGAPVFNHFGEVIAAISIAGPAFRIRGRRLQEMTAAVVSAAHDLSALLGFRRGAGSAAHARERPVHLRDLRPR